MTGIATSQISVLGPGGTATLEACLANPSGTYLGTVIGAEVDNFPFCGGSPTFPVPANTLLPAATCATSCQPPPPGNKSGVKFNDLNQNGVQDGAEPGLIGWTIHLFNTGTMALLQTKVTLAANPGPPTPDGFYAFDPLPPGNYTVCEALQAGWTQTAPLAVPPPAGETLANCAPFGVANGLTLGPRGYSFTITAAAEVFAANNFGNFLPPGDCPEDPLRASKITRVVDQTGTSHGPAPVYFTVQDAYDAAGLTGEVIGLFSQTTENVVLNDAKSLTITQCRNARVTAADSTLPVWTISSTKSLLIIGPDAVGGTVGWLFQTGNHEAKGLRASGASQFGIQVMSNNNSVAWNSANNNAVGVGVSGSFNSLRGGTVQGNTSDGVQISGNSNTLQGATVQSNLGVGINVSGTSNTLKNDKSNTTGQGGTKENGGAEYCFANNTTQDLGSNKKDNANFVGQIAGSPKRYATGCYE